MLERFTFGGAAASRTNRLRLYVMHIVGHKSNLSGLLALSLSLSLSACACISLPRYTLHPSYDDPKRHERRYIPLSPTNEAESKSYPCVGSSCVGETGGGKQPWLIFDGKGGGGGTR